MRCKNNINILGYVVNDPIIIQEDPYLGIKFKVQTTKSYFSQKDNMPKVKRERHTIKAWKKQAEFIMNHVKHDDIVDVEGEMHYHTFELTCENGEIFKCRNAEINASEVIKPQRASEDNDEQDQTSTSIQD